MLGKAQWHEGLKQHKQASALQRNRSTPVDGKSGAATVIMGRQRQVGQLGTAFYNLDARGVARGSGFRVTDGTQMW